MTFEKICEDIFRLKVPFEGIYTAVWMLRDGEACILLDAATTESDVTDYILPALERMNAHPTHLACSHHHDDHSGGMAILAARFPDAVLLAADPGLCRRFSPCAVSHKQALSKHVYVLHLPGHTEDMLGLWDERSRTLITGDALQLDGVDRWGTCVAHPAAYRHTLEQILALAPERLLASHDFVPLGFRAEGKAAVQEYVAQCERSLKRIQSLVQTHGELEAKALRELICNRSPELPPVALATVRALLSEENNYIK